MEKTAFLDPDFIMALVALIGAVTTLVKLVLDGRAQKKENASLRKQIQVLTEENRKLHLDIDGLVKALGASDEKIDTLQDAYDFLRTQYDTLKNKYDLLKSQYETLQANYKAMQAENELLRQKVNGVEKKQTGSLKAE